MNRLPRWLESTTNYRMAATAHILHAPQMANIFDKLNLKEHREILVLDAPASFENEIKALKDVNVVRTLGPATRVSFALAFCTRKAQVDRASKAIAAQAQGDIILWFAYPKGTSKNFKCDFNRDVGWDVIKAAGFDTVRQIAIDADWSALRFRRVEFIDRR
jgi:hypothetical protein